ncbi:MAG: DUF3604 domain-containing protein [Deltaproteobacteria bacterium]|nr:DUF3604 domain-containing protein [Deltaproteobacteria bacterium]MBW2362311.1 DUF3604 domain-containing protein [Deltaproteobacteria bacterium]
MAELPRIPRDPDRRAFFGDLHIHTALSPDAYVFGVRAMPNDAYRFAKGATIEHGAGYAIQISRPLDFAAVTDHSEFLGTTRALGDQTSLQQRSLRHRLQNDGKLALTWAYFKTIAELNSQGFRSDGIPEEVAWVPAEAWRTTIDAAEQHNEPGTFTAFIAYEWSSFSRGGGHLHRNVIYGSSRAPDKPFSSTDSPKPRGLWEALDRQRADGIPVLAIPHNPNLSNGETFDVVDKDGNAFDANYAETRRRNEPLTEIFQVKGTSETHPLLSAGDEFADFEIHEMFIAGEPEGLDRRGNYTRAALRRGLELAQAQGYNPFDFGVIGSSDGHGASSPIEEDNFFGKLPMLDGSAAIRLEQTTFVPKGAMPAPEWGAAGLAGIWAEENTRESLFAAMRRKETFATSGPRLRIRLFGGWHFDASLLERSDAIRRCYAGGVPMGGELPERGAANAPGFLVWAVRDPDGANLDRLQIVKGWVDANGESAEKIFEVTASDGRLPDAETGKLAPLASSVDLETATYSNRIGASELSAFWRDPEFDTTQRAFYYARVIEIPTPRWSTYDAVKLGIDPPVPHSLQERAVTSAIWYDPGR